MAKTYYNKTSFDQANLLNDSTIIQSTVELTRTGATVINTPLPVTYNPPTVELTPTGATITNTAPDPVALTTTGATVEAAEPLDSTEFTTTGATITKNELSGDVTFYQGSGNVLETLITTPAAPAAPATVQLVAVQVDQGNVIWAFDTVIESIDVWQNPFKELPLLVQAEDMDGILIWWTPTKTALDADPHTLIVTYDIPMASPLPWKVEANPTALHFAGGGTLQIPASGTA